jgi:hypothetical protein
MPKLQYNLDEIKSFQIKPGTYRLKLTKVEQGVSNNKKPQYVWSWKVVSGSEKGKTLRSFTSLQENALSNLKAHLEAFGLSGKVKTSTEKLVGRTIIAVIGDRISINPRTKVEQVYPNILSMRPDPKAQPEEEEDVEDEVEDTEDEDEEEAPRRPIKKVKKAPSKFKRPAKKSHPVEEDDEDEDEDEDDEDLDEDDEDLPF